LGFGIETRKERVPVALVFRCVGARWGVARETLKERVSHNSFPGILKMPKYQYPARVGILTLYW
jgi:hypothetical protein